MKTEVEKEGMQPQVKEAQGPLEAERNRGDAPPEAWEGAGPAHPGRRFLASTL